MSGNVRAGAAALSCLLAAAPLAVRAQQGEGDLRRAVALLDYVAGDYARAVGEHGEVLVDSEFHEQVGFVRDAAHEVRSGAGPAGADLAARLDALSALVERKGPPAQVAAQARGLRDELAQRFKVAILPAAPPDPARGKALYAQGCAICHGAEGRAPSQESLELSTQPPSFADPAAVAQLAPQRIFSAATYGVPNTAMPAYDTAWDDAARWDLAFFVLTLAHPQADPQALARGRKLAQAAMLRTGYRDLAAQSDELLSAQLAHAGLAAPDRALALAALRAGPFAEERESSSALALVRRDLHGALGLAGSGDREGARRAVISAYLDHFEPSEPSLRARNAPLVQEIEAGFLRLRQALDREDPAQAAATARDAVDSLDALLEKADAAAPGGTVVAFFAALTIALREGVEAALLVGLLLALLRKANRSADARAVHLGWASALLAGGATWFASGLLLHLGGASREFTEGALQLLTAALLLYASHWVLAASSAKKLVGFISAKTLAGGSAVVVFWLAFGAVYREMFEVVIFFRGLLFETPGGGAYVLAGALLGLAILAVLVVLFQRVGKRLQPRPLLLTCGVMLCALAVLMVGKGIHALQETGAVPLTVWGGFELPSLGLYPTREGLVAQALVLAGLVCSALWTLLRARRIPLRGLASS